MNSRRKIIAVDFDNTLCLNKESVKWPFLGEENKELVEALKRLQAEGVALILWTCREGKLLECAVEWCKSQCGLTFDAVNDNIESTKTFFGVNSRKIHCDYYIDDKGCTPEMFYAYLAE